MQNIMDIELKHSGVKSAAARSTNSQKVMDLNLEVDQIIRRDEKSTYSVDPDYVEARFVFESVVTPFRQQQSLPIKTPDKSDAAHRAMTPRRSSRKSVKPVQNYDEIVANSCFRRSKKQGQGDVQDEFDYKWTPAKVGRVSQKRGRRSRKANASIKCKPLKQHTKNDDSEENKENLEEEDEDQIESDQANCEEDKDTMEEEQHKEEEVMEKKLDHLKSDNRQLDYFNVEDVDNEDEKARELLIKQTEERTTEEGRKIKTESEQSAKIEVKYVEENVDKPLIDLIEADALKDPNNITKNQIMVAEEYKHSVMEMNSKTVGVLSEGHQMDPLAIIAGKVDKAMKEKSIAAQTSAEGNSDLDLTALQTIKPKQPREIEHNENKLGALDLVETTKPQYKLGTIDISATPEKKAQCEKLPGENTLNETFDANDCFIVSPKPTEYDYDMQPLRLSDDEDDAMPKCILTAIAPFRNHQPRTKKSPKRSSSNKKSPFEGKSPKPTPRTSIKSSKTSSKSNSMPFHMLSKAMLNATAPARGGDVAANAAAATSSGAGYATVFTDLTPARPFEWSIKPVATPTKRAVADDNSGVLLARTTSTGILIGSDKSAMLKSIRHTPAKAVSEKVISSSKMSMLPKTSKLSAKKATPNKCETGMKTAAAGKMPFVTLLEGEDLIQVTAKSPTNASTNTRSIITPKKCAKAAARFPTPRKKNETSNSIAKTGEEQTAVPFTSSAQKLQSIIKYNLTDMDASQYIANSIRKRSLSVCVDGEDNERINRTRGINRVKFHSPANETTLIEDLDVIMAKNAANKKDDFVTQRRKRSMSFDEAIAQKSNLPRPLVADMKGANQSKSRTATTPQRSMPMRTKLPNFAAIHKKQFEKMENLIEHVHRKSERAKTLTSSATKSSVRPGGLLKLVNNEPDNLTVGNTAAAVERPKAAKRIALDGSSLKTVEPTTDARQLKATDEYVLANGREKHSRLPIAGKFEPVNVAATKRQAQPILVLKKPMKPTQVGQQAVEVNKLPHNIMQLNATTGADENTAVASTQSTTLENKFDKRRQRHMDLFKNRSTVGTRAVGGATGANVTRNFGEIIRGVRSNRRFNLQMQHRMQLEQNQP